MSRPGLCRWLHRTAPSFRAEAATLSALSAEGDGVYTTPRSLFLLSLLAVCAVGLLLAPACAANRRFVRVQTQLELMNNDLAAGQRVMDRNLDSAMQLMQYNLDTLEAADARIDNMRTLVNASRSEQELAILGGRLERLCTSAQDLNSTMVEIESRASEVKQLQDDLLRLPTIR